MSESLSALEREALGLLLAGDHPMLAALRKQAEVCRVSERRFDGVGFFSTLALSPGTPAIAVGRRRVVLDGVGVSWAGLDHGASVIVFIDEGRLTLLEGFTYADPWPLDPANWRVFPQTVSRGKGVETNLEQLEAAWIRPDPDRRVARDIRER